MAETNKNEQATTKTNVMRYEFADYLDIGANEYHLMNTGFTSLGYTAGTQEDTVQYVGDKVSSSNVTGYQTEFPYTAELIKEQECTLALFETAEEQKIGSEAMFNYVRVRMDKPQSAENTYEAKKYKVTNVVSDGASEPGKATVSGTLKQNGNFVKGTFNIATRTFTETI